MGTHFGASKARGSKYDNAIWPRRCVRDCHVESRSFYGYKRDERYWKIRKDFQAKLGNLYMASKGSSVELNRAGRIFTGLRKTLRRVERISTPGKFSGDLRVYLFWLHPTGWSNYPQHLPMAKS